MAGSFVILAITGLNLLYGQYVLIPIIGKEAFATFTTVGKYAHNYLAFAFMVGITLGLPAGYYGGRFDTVLSFISNLVLASRFGSSKEVNTSKDKNHFLIFLN